MAFGLMVRTTLGMSDLSNITSLRRVYSTDQSAASGNIAIPSSVAVVSAIPYAQVNDGGFPPYVTIDATNNRLIWSNGGSSDFTINIYRVD